MRLFFKKHNKTIENSKTIYNVPTQIKQMELLSGIIPAQGF